MEKKLLKTVYSFLSFMLLMCATWACLCFMNLLLLEGFLLACSALGFIFLIIVTPDIDTSGIKIDKEMKKGFDRVGAILWLVATISEAMMNGYVNGFLTAEELKTMTPHLDSFLQCMPFCFEVDYGTFPVAMVGALNFIFVTIAAGMTAVIEVYRSDKNDSNNDKSRLA